MHIWVSSNVNDLSGQVEDQWLRWNGATGNASGTLTDEGRNVRVVGSTDNSAAHVHGATMRLPVWEQTGGRMRGARRGCCWQH
eukprot:1993886-Pleurochrysis_carterae.AAC.1